MRSRLGSQSATLTMSHSLGEIERLISRTGRLPAFLRPIRRCEIAQLPPQWAGVVAPHPLPQPVASQAKQAVAGVPRTALATLDRLGQDLLGGLLSQTQRHQRCQRQDEYQHSLVLQIPYVAGF